MPDSIFDRLRKRQQLGHSLKREMYTVEQAAEAMGISERRVRDLIAKGKLDHVRPSERTIRIPKQAIIDYLEPSPFKGFFS